MSLNIRIVREAGGLGDTIRVLPVLREMRRQHLDANIWVYAPKTFTPIYKHSGVQASYIHTPMGRLRRRRLSPLNSKRWPYLAPPTTVEKWDIEVDMYCPGFYYEVQAGYRTAKNRIQCFLEAAKLWPCYPLPRYYVTKSEEKAASVFLHEHKLKQSKVIALQPFCTDRGREWPEEHWIYLANSLEAQGHPVIILDICKGRVRRFRQLCITAMSIEFIAALLKQCRLLVCPDSGLFHLTAAVDTPALGLFASQPGKVMSHFYPLHHYIEPDRKIVKAPCKHWPCIWRRLPECRPSIAKETCRVLRQLTLQEVLTRVLTILDNDKG